jgi:hypothetical protein
VEKLIQQNEKLTKEIAQLNQKSFVEHVLYWADNAQKVGVVVLYLYNLKRKGFLNVPNPRRPKAFSEHNAVRQSRETLDDALFTEPEVTFASIDEVSGKSVKVKTNPHVIGLLQLGRSKSADLLDRLCQLCRKVFGCSGRANIPHEYDQFLDAERE